MKLHTTMLSHPSTQCLLAGAFRRAATSSRLCKQLSSGTGIGTYTVKFPKFQLRVVHTRNAGVIGGFEVLLITRDFSKPVKVTQIVKDSLRAGQCRVN